MRKALFAGSFNPFTVGHADIVKRGLELFDEVVIAIGENQDKPSADIHERLQAIRDVYKDEPRVRVEVYHSLTVDFAREIGACALLRGVRTAQDFEYERQMADANAGRRGSPHGAEHIGGHIGQRRAGIKIQQLHHQH